MSLSHALDPEVGHRRSCILVGFAVLDGRRRPEAADELRARRGPGLPLRATSSCPTRPRSSGPTRSAGRSTRSSTKTEGIDDVTTVAGFSLLSGTTAPYNGFYFVALKPWDERKGADLSATGDRPAAQRRARAARSPRRSRSRFPPPPIPGLGNVGRLLVLAPGPQRRHASSSSTQNLQKFLEACRKRPELTGVQLLVPRLRAPGLRRRQPRQGPEAGRRGLRDVYQTLQAFLGGLFVNQFNRFGRQWRVYLQAEGDAAEPHRRHRRSSTCATTTATWCRSRRCDHGTEHRGPGYTNRFNLFRAAQIIGNAAPGYSSGQAMAALEQVAARGPAARDGLRLGRPVVPGETGRRARRDGSSPSPSCFVFLILAALYESWSLPFSVLLSVPVAVFGAFLGLLVRAARPRRLRADRPDHADRPRREERDPDRRVREAEARAGRGASSRPRSTARSCGCGRS